MTTEALLDIIKTVTNKNMDHLQRQHAIDQIEMHFNAIKKELTEGNEELIDSRIDDLNDDIEDLENKLKDRDTEIVILQFKIDQTRKLVDNLNAGEILNSDEVYELINALS